MRVKTGIKARSLGLAIAAFGIAFGCNNSSDSENKSIATDLDSDAAYLYWIQGENVVKGRCLPAAVVVKSNCMDGMSKMPYGQFKQALDLNLADDISTLEHQITSLKDSFKSAKEKLKLVLQKIAQDQHQLGLNQEQHQDLNDQAESFEVNVVELKEQLDLISLSLANVQNQDLLAMSKQIASELEGIRSKLAGIYTHLPIIMQQINDLLAGISSAHDEIDQTKLTMQELKAQYTGASNELKQMQADMAKYNLTLEELESGIIYRVFADSDWFSEVRPFVRKFHEITGFEISSTPE